MYLSNLVLNKYIHFSDTNINTIKKKTVDKAEYLKPSQDKDSYILRLTEEHKEGASFPKLQWRI